MSAKPDLLPLDMPRRFEFTRQEVRALARDYARANVAHATAAKDAEIEALRAEVAEWKRVASAQAELHGDAEARAERLAGALRFARTRFARYMDDTDRAAFDAALDQENGRG